MRKSTLVFIKVGFICLGSMVAFFIAAMLTTNSS